MECIFFCYFFITWTIKVFAAISCPFLSTNIQDTLLLLFRSFLSTTLSTTATGGSASTLIEGVTISNLSFPSSFGIITLHFPMRLIRHQFLFQQMLSLLRALLNLILLRFINLANKLFRLIFTIIIFFSAYPHAAK